MKTAITGGIGSGKSFICRKLALRGLEIYDCDSAAKRLMATSDVIKSSLIKAVGQDVFIEGKLNKAVLTTFLLKNADNAKIINGIVHPVVAEDFVKSGLDWMECAILFTSGFDKLVDKTICVTAPTDVRISRIMKRDGISFERACEWINNQMPQEDIVARSDFEIVNDGRTPLDEQIDRFLRQHNQEK